MSSPEQPVEVAPVVEPPVPGVQVVVERDPERALHLRPERRAERPPCALDPVRARASAAPRPSRSGTSPPPVGRRSTIAVGNSVVGEISSTGSPRSRSIASSAAGTASPPRAAAARSPTFEASRSRASGIPPRYVHDGAGGRVAGDRALASPRAAASRRRRSSRAGPASRRRSTTGSAGARGARSSA